MIRLTVLIAAVLCVMPQARADHLVTLKAPFYGCEHKDDIAAIARLAKEAPRDIRVGAVRAYGRRHCVTIGRRATTIQQSDGDYVCLRRARSPCLWTLRVLIDVSGVDDGVF